MEHYTIAQLAAALGTNENTLRDWMERAEIVATPGRRDGRIKVVSRGDAERLATLHDCPLRDISELPSTLEAAWREIVKLRAEIERMKADAKPTYAPVTRYEPILSVSPHRLIDSSFETTYRHPSPSLSLPDGLVSVEAFANRHGWPLQTIKQAIIDGRLEETTGEWKMKRAIVKHALNPEQQRAMLALYRAHPRFQECEVSDCSCHPR
jgi:transposase-like protein